MEDPRQVTSAPSSSRSLLGTGRWQRLSSSQWHPTASEVQRDSRWQRLEQWLADTRTDRTALERGKATAKGTLVRHWVHPDPEPYNTQRHQSGRIV